MLRTERWSELKDAFAAVVDLPPDARARRLAGLETTDPELHANLTALLHGDAHAAAMLSAVEPARPRPAIVEFDLTGQTVSHFRVLDVLGSGGMGVVYRAEDVRLGRTVALKFLLPQDSFEARARERFLKEARAASALDHPNVCTVYEAGESESGHVFLAMAYYPGDTLKKRLGTGSAIGIGEAVAIATQVLHGLAAAHRAGIVHRDLKPGNLLLAADGTVRILDFGLARARSDDDVNGPGLPPGTVPYMSPEQLAGEMVDQRTDLWSLGVVLYEMLTGRSPFRPGHELSTVHSILNDAPAPPSRVRPGVPAALDSITLRLLDKDPGERYASATDVIADLANAGMRVRPWRRRITHAAAALIFVIFALAGVAAATRLDRSPAGLPQLVTGAAANSIAVLPFSQPDAEGEPAYFGDGMAEEILNALHSVPELRVTSRTSAFAFRGTALPLTEVARRLGVRTLLGGTVRRSGTHVRITAWILDAQSDRELWSQSFEGELDDIAAVQTEIARAVTGALEPGAASAHGLAIPRATRNHVAYDAYLHGLFHWHRRTPADIQEAIHYFEQAIQIDSTYARAYEGLALAYAVLPLLVGIPAGDVVPRIEAAASRALALEPSLASPDAALGYVYHLQWRWEEAEHAFRRALALDPNHSAALQWYGEHAVKRGRATEAEQLLRRAVALDPLSTVAQTNLGLVLWLGGRSDAAIAQFEYTLRMDPGLHIAHLLLFRSRLAARDLEGAVTAGRAWADQTGQADPDEIETVTRGALGAGSRAAALAILARWEGSPVHLRDVVLCLAMLGETDHALTVLERAVEQHDPMLAALGTHPWASLLGGEPRYQRLAERIGFSR